MAITFEQIYESYHKAKYGYFEIIIDLSDGYVNVTRLCLMGTTRYNARKKFSNWMLNKDAFYSIEELHNFGICSRDKVIRRHPSGKFNLLGGKYAHPKLVPRIACWADVDIAIGVKGILTAYYAGNLTVISKSSTDVECADMFAIYKYEKNEYRMIRCKRKSYNLAVNICHDRGLCTRVYAKSVPSAMELYIKINRELCGKKIIRFISEVNFELCDPYTESDLVKWVETIESGLIV